MGMGVGVVKMRLVPMNSPNKVAESIVHPTRRIESLSNNVRYVRQEHHIMIMDCNCKNAWDDDRGGWQKCAKREEYMQVEAGAI
ncbi:hypothetical protein MTR_3g014160 [Medicago truncatula]|uniref:Uncharacterized protein n=1 Tax=Medicago truncatula TaxID=3880 RepID=G7IYR5_MEDTR|nr:hypothetical protein MTR_3g014160 [Medicago truncatula]